MRKLIAIIFSALEGFYGRGRAIERFVFIIFLRFKTAGGALSALTILKLQLVLCFLGCEENIAARMNKNEMAEPVIREGSLPGKVRNACKNVSQ